MNTKKKNINPADFEEARAIAAASLEQQPQPVEEADELRIPEEAEGDPARGEIPAEPVPTEPVPAEPVQGEADGPMQGEADAAPNGANGTENPAPAPAKTPEDVTEELIAQINRLTEENRILGLQLKEQSDLAQSRALESAAEPEIDFAELRKQLLHGSDEEGAAAVQTLLNQAGAMGYAQAMSEISPMLEGYRMAADRRAMDDVFAQLADVPQLKGLGEMRPDLEIIGDKFFSDRQLSPADRITRAYIYKRGLDSINAPEPKAFTRDDALKMYKDDPQLRQAIEAERFATRGSAASAPPVMHSSGMSNAAPTIPKSPESMAEAGDMAMAYIKRNGI